MAIQQPAKALTVSMADEAAITSAFSMKDSVSGMVIVPAAWIAANMGFQVCATRDGTFAILRLDDTNEPVQIKNMSTTAIRAYVLPTKLFSAHWVKLWSKSSTDVTETDTNQTGGPLSFILMLK